MPRKQTLSGIGNTVTVNRHIALRTRRAGSPNTKRKAREMLQAELRDTALKLYLERVSQADIGAALNLSQGRVSQIIKAAWEARIPERTKTIEDAHAMALAETHHYASYWATRAKSSPRAADVMLGLNQSADPSTYRRKNSVRTTRATAVSDAKLIEPDRR